jgi:hypothetical protein
MRYYLWEMRSYFRLAGGPPLLATWLGKQPWRMAAGLPAAESETPCGAYHCRL